MPPVGDAGDTGPGDVQGGLDVDGLTETQQAASDGRTCIATLDEKETVVDAVACWNGRIVAMGPHDKLVAEGGLYARLARLQFTDGIAAE